MTHFFQRVREFNATFGIPAQEEPRIESHTRIRRFKEILYEEVQEADSIVDVAELAD